MIPELEKPKVTEIKVRMDCNGCVQKIKKALYGINGIYDLYIDFPQQKLTIIGWADPERIMKALKKTRKIATLCSDSEQTDQQAAAQPGDQPPPNGGGTVNFQSIEAPPPFHDAAAAVSGPYGHSSMEVAPGQVVFHDAHSGPHFDLTNATGQQATQPHGSHEPGQVYVNHHQPPEHGHVVHHHSSEPGQVVHHQGQEHGHVIHQQGQEQGHVVHHQVPEHGHVGYHPPSVHGHEVHHHQPEHSHVIGHHQPPDGGHVAHHHQPLDHSHVVHQPPEHSHTVHHQPIEHNHGHGHGHVFNHHQPEPGHGHTSSYNYHHNTPGAVHMPTSTQPATVIHSYNTYKPSPYVTEYIRPMISHRPSPYTSEYIPQQPTTHYSSRMLSPYTSEYIPQQPTTHYSSRMDRYNEDYYNTGTSSSNGNITSIFSDENPNACNLM